MSRRRGAIDLATAALGGTLATIRAVHTAIARKPFSALRPVPAAGEASEAVRAVHDGVTALVYTGLGGAITVAGGAARLADSLAARAETEPPADSLAAQAVAAINGFAGERLERESNALAEAMSLRQDGRAVALEPASLAAAFPEATSRLAVFVHGLACNESMWRRDSARHYGDEHTSYGSRLERDLGYTPLYLRYNTGLHISENGRRLAALLERLVSVWPVPVEEMVLVGHSMGGLVLRGAAHYGAELEWARRVRHMFYLGSPHRGAPLEKAVNVAGWLLGLVDITRPLAEALNARSGGVKDLRFGAVRDEDWQGVDLDAPLANRAGDVPLLTGAAHYFVTATVTLDPRHPLGLAVGDLLVRHASASGPASMRHLELTLDGRHFGAMGHLELVNHPEVYAQMRRWLDA